jgi:hypothetical protein
MFLVWHKAEAELEVDLWIPPPPPSQLPGPLHALSSRVSSLTSLVIIATANKSLDAHQHLAPTVGKQGTAS